MEGETANPGADGGERELVGKVLARDPKAWEVFVQRFAPLVHLAVYRALMHFGKESARAEIETLAEKTFARLLENDGERLRKFEFRSELGAWIVLLTNHIVNESSGLPPSRMGLSANGDKPSGEECWKAFEELAPRDRLILSMLFNSRKKNQEIAQTLNLSLKVVGMAIARLKHRCGLVKDPPPEQVL